ncbi:hypothetical protein HEP81_00439 [Streptomyces griseofuscus]|uniref:Phthiocerol/phthiodiolone dimycocerosyl transferase C-terminal domain-containing protein n=1 Tax=Streptomyces griseofuscus TaxID=146922 RepID=A0A7H1PRU5_9ACTN|nr:hypothetical protein HEP81_00439 [Streptomyces griseofuscus]
MDPERVLAPSEAAMAMAGGPVVVGWTVQGSLDHELPGAAVRELSHRMPVFAARIVEGPDGLVLRRDRADAAVGLEPVPDTWAPQDAAFLRPGDQVLCVLLRREGPDRHRPGAACLARGQRRRLSDDAASAALGDLPGFGRGKGRYDSSLPLRGVAPAVEDRLRERYGASDVAACAADWSARLDAAQPAVLAACAAREGGPGPGHGAHRHRFTLSAEQTRSLVRHARRSGATVNSVVCALAMRAVRDLLPSEGGPVQLTCLIPVDVRPRLQPPLSADEFAFAASTTSATALVGPHTELGLVASEIDRQVHASLDAGHAELKYLAPSRMLTRLASAAITVAASNVSHHCTAPPLPEGLTAARLVHARTGGRAGRRVAARPHRFAVAVHATIRRNILCRRPAGPSR